MTLTTFSSEQRSQLLLRLQSGGGEKAVTQMIESRLEGRPDCPHCTSTQVVKNGHADGLRRYKCRGCGKTFNALSGTSLARLRHRDKMADAGQCSGGGAQRPKRRG